MNNQKTEIVMMRVMNRLAFLALFATTLLFSACETDDPLDPGGDLEPEIRLLSDAGFISTSSQVAPGETFRVKVNAVAGTANLRTLRITESGTNVPLNRLTIAAGGATITNNPLLITMPYLSGATWEISIQAPVDPGVRTYEFTVTDEATLSASVSIDVEVFGELSVSLPRGNDDVTVQGKSDYAVSVIGSRGASPLNTLAIYADGELVPADSLLFGGTSVGQNPIVLVGPEKTNFDTELIIKTANSGTKTYTIELKDESGAAVNTSFNLTVLVEYTALLVNNKDGQNFGGLDLDTGETVAFNSDRAEIRDKGIDLGRPVAQNWYQQILPRPGVELREPDLTQAENFSYENATSRAAIVAAFDTGIAKTESDVVAVGDLFLVKRADHYYLLQCVEINVTPSNNNDFYRFNVKQVRGKEQ